LLRKQNPFADGGKINKFFDKSFLELIGPETEEDKKIKQELKKAKKGKNKKKKKAGKKG